jgi:Mrp family chromosome partitioning ATPase
MRWGALQAIMDAAHDPIGHPSPPHAYPGEPVAELAKPAGFTEQRYAALLARLMVGENTQNPRRILFVATCPRTQSTPIALGVTRAAAALVGRTLLVDGWTALQDHHPYADHAAEDGAEATRRVLPDTFVPRLHHYRLGTSASDTKYLFSQAREDAMAPLTASFQFIVIDAPPPSYGPVANALAGACAGCVVVVGAGITRDTDIQNTLRDLRCAGATIMGTILADAPEHLPGWARGGGGIGSNQAGRARA